MGRYAEDAKELLSLVGGEGKHCGSVTLYDTHALCFE